MKNYLSYKGYDLEIVLSEDCSKLFGKVVGIKDGLFCEGETVDLLRKDFKETINDYFEDCKALGKTPEKPFKGVFSIRTKPQLHRALALEADADGISLNALINRLLTQHVEISGKTL